MAYNDENNGYDSNSSTGYDSNNNNEPKENPNYNSNNNQNNNYNPDNIPNGNYNSNNNYNPNNVPNGNYNSNNNYNPNNVPNGNYNPNNNFPPYAQSNDYRKPASNGFATASLVIGIISLVSLCLVYIPLFIAPMGIILGLLSKKGSKKTGTAAKVGIGLAIGGFCVSLVTTVVILVFAFSYMDSDTYRELFEGIENGYDMEDYQNIYDYFKDIQNY